MGTTTEMMALSPPEDPLKRVQVIHAERLAIDERQREVYKTASAETRPLTGLALSGGGIRSATFCLGVLEEMNQRGVSRLFDYLSTVSGGGYIGGWWSAYLSRKRRAGGHGLMTAMVDAFTGMVSESAVFKACAPGLMDKAQQARKDDATETPAFKTLFPTSRLAGGSETEDIALRHLRLHSNYLTPRKGLSWDTWRAVTVIGRNLVLTWAVLLPFTVAAVVACQMYFLVAAPDLFTKQPGTFADLWMLWALWWGAAGPPLAGIFAVIGALTFAWLLYQGPKSRMPPVGVCAALLLIAAIVRARATGVPDIRFVQFTAAAGLAAALLFAVRYIWSVKQSLPTQSDSSVRRNQILFVQERFVALLAVGGACLATGGLAHLLVPLAATRIDASIMTAGGWTAVLGSFASAAYTVLKAAPAGGADTVENSGSRLQRLVFAVAPALLMIVLVVVIAQFSRDTLLAASASQKLFHALLTAALIGVLLSWVYASYETSWHKLHASRGTTVAVAGVGIMAGAFASTIGRHFSGTALLWLLFGFAVWCFDVLARRLGASARSDEERHRANVVAHEVLKVRLLGLTAALMTFAAGMLTVNVGNVSLLAELSVLALVSSIALFALTFWTGLGQKAKSLYLLGYGIAVSALLTIFSLQGWLPPTPAAQVESGVPLVVIAAALLMTAGAWTLAFGWSTDPNNLSMHAFYRARLVRAYLGASNVERRSSNALIEDAVPGDDVELAQMRNTARGGPYHLVNATLNLSGDTELGSVQRRAAPFIFAKLFCGGEKCGYRDSRTYMGGQMTLGTAVAISGAAASPNMGSQTPGAPLSMLMTLFNVRLGFWAPTPKQQAWRSRQARFWSFYTLKEFLSRTTDTASYCFLSDGGHFDNTGVYSLVERGCRIIFAIDCGADARRTFADLGNMARRVRIDFDAEIDIDLADLGPNDPKTCRSPFVVGTILYSSRHLREIGDSRPNDTDGYLVMIKPSVLGYEPADVRQYSFGEGAFPQQSTADQFFDEAQFESYRRLGMHCAECALDALLPASGGTPEEMLKGLQESLRISVLGDDTPASPSDSASHRIFQQLKRRAEQALEARGLTVELATESLLWNYLRRASATMLQSGRRRADDVEDALFAVSRLTAMMADAARKRSVSIVEEEDFIEARSGIAQSFPFALLHMANRG